jgi:hypothetical protein
MIVTGIAPTPKYIRERRNAPSPELVYLAKKALIQNNATGLITSLAWGWEQALVKAAIELDIPFTTAVPFPGRDAEFEREDRVQYLDLLAHSSEVYRISECYTDTALLEGHLWQVDHAGMLLALWEYNFDSETFCVIDYAMKQNRQVINLWEDWQHLYSLRRLPPTPNLAGASTRGAQVFNRKE